MVAQLGWCIVVACLWFDNTCLFNLRIFDRFGLNLCAICVRRECVCVCM